MPKWPELRAACEQTDQSLRSGNSFDAVHPMHAVAHTGSAAIMVLEGI